MDDVDAKLVTQDIASKVSSPRIVQKVANLNADWALDFDHARAFSGCSRAHMRSTRKRSRSEHYLSLSGLMAMLIPLCLPS